MVTEEQECIPSNSNVGADSTGSGGRHPFGTITCELLEAVDIEARAFLSCREVLGHDDLFEEGHVFDDEGSSVWLPGDDVGVIIVLSFI